jgi:Rrf2 family transcriptional regulator, nitric oxide-sensitive transcriptional repressor
MHLTSFSDYTLRTFIYLGLRPGELCTVDEIATAFDISANHLMKVVQQAAQAGDVQTVRGQRGGVRLAHAPEAINIGTVLRRTEPDLNIVACFGCDCACRIQPACVMQGVLGDALAAFMAVVDRMTLADLIRPKHHLSALLHLEAAEQGATALEGGH